MPTWTTLNPRQAVPVTEGQQYHAALRAIRGVKASGVYAIIAKGSREVLYVGESHTGRLYDTITRHFRVWRRDPSTDEWGRRRGGTTYDRHACLFHFELTPADAAAPAQYAHIQRLRPRDNAIVGESVVDLPF